MLDFLWYLWLYCLTAWAIGFLSLRWWWKAAVGSEPTVHPIATIALCVMASPVLAVLYVIGFFTYLMAGAKALKSRISDYYTIKNQVVQQEKQAQMPQELAR